MMGTSEIAFLNCISRNHLCAGTLDINSWLEDFGLALRDILNESTGPNSYEDVSYHREKIAILLFMRALSSEKFLISFHPMWKDFCAVSESCVPILTWFNFFDSISFLGLGPEFATTTFRMDVSIQELVEQNLCDWVKFNCQQSGEVYKLSLVTSFLGSVVLSLMRPTSNGPWQISLLEECYTILLESLENINLELTDTIVSNAHLECLKLMVEKLEQDNSENVKAIANAYSPDALYLSNMSQILQTTCVDELPEKFAHFLTTRNSSKIQDGEGKCSLPVSSTCISSAEKSITKLEEETENEVLKEIYSSLNKCLSLQQTKQRIDTFSFMSELSKDLFIVQHCLEGYDEATARLLQSMISDPLENKKLKETLSCLQTSSECLAVKSNLLTIVDIIAQCVILADTRTQHTELRVLASEFQLLFWKGFSLLPVASKYDLAKEVIYLRKDFHLLSQCVVMNDGLNSTTNSAVDHNLEKTVRLFFENVPKQDALNDLIRAEFSSMLLQSPLLTLEKVVENAFFYRIPLITDVIFEWDYLLQFSYNQHQTSTFWTKYFHCLKSHNGKGDRKSVDNGISFIRSLFDKFASSKSEHFEALVREGFNLCGNGLSGTSGGLNTASKMLYCRVLVVFSESPLFCATMSAIELLSLSVTLGTIIDSCALLCWGNPTYNDDDVDLLDDLFETLFGVVMEKFTTLKDHDYSQFLSITKWLSHVVKDFVWTTQLRFLPLLQQIDGFKLSVPACLAEVCEIPGVFHASADLCYGAGTGLLAWHQCFAINSNLCPLSSLDNNFLEVADTKLFTGGWIVTLSQILPFCKSRQWLKLMEASKVLIAEYKLYCPYQCTQVTSLPNIHVPEVSSLLATVQVINSVFDILCNEDCVDWTSKLNFVLLAKRYSEVSSWLVYNSPEFAKASLLSQTFTLSQIFCSVCYIAKLIRNIAGNDQVQSCVETLFILCLDILGSFEKILVKLIDDAKSDDDKSSDCSSSITSSSLSCSDLTFGKDYRVLELVSRIDEMHLSTSCMLKEQCEILSQKLCVLQNRTTEM